MPVIQAKDQQRVNMRREQVERFLASDSTVSEWCRLNKVSESTFYKWMAYFREAEPESFAGPGRAGKWIEVSRAELAASTALAVTGPAGARVAPAAPGHATAVPVRPLDKACVSSSRCFVNHHPKLSGLSTKVFRVSPRAAQPSLPSCFPA